ncbi:zinc-ribbon domain containing protein [Paucibacter sp. APW11]|uniref:Zinc-ribbon domain containing protein n=1 Tax=Roseateles aquae TaxID=3077235 RepID=A0ABU3PJ88_9BURK|nr:zinc-ribbon domain containing protein [Paucibacter sp. APW11]MDT9002472.1 zinc-ribbon domain containing protein [Paucibacter sp. APW11]
MKQQRPPILEHRRVKRGVMASESARERERERTRAHMLAAKKHVLVNPNNLLPTNSVGKPDFVKRGYYLDRPFNCKSCGVAQVWTETQQKWWYESAKGDVWTIAVLCRPCRKREQDRRNAARDVHFAGIADKGKNAA